MRGLHRGQRSSKEDLEADGATVELGESPEQLAEEEVSSRAAERERQRFLASPVGQARTAFERGDQVFQYSHSVHSQQAVIVAMVGSTVTAQTSDPLTILNALCREDWDLVNGTFVFIDQGQQSRDKFVSSGENVAIKRETVGYYLFRRSKAHRLTDESAETITAQ